MRRWRWVGVLGLGLLVGACAGANEPPTTADLIFPIPWVLKQPRPLAPVPAEAPAETGTRREELLMRQRYGRTIATLAVLVLLTQVRYARPGG